MKKIKAMKRIAACTFAAALGLASVNVPVLAADTTVTVTGDVNYVDMSAYTQVLVPTTTTLQFALDPQGLSTMTGTSAATNSLDAGAGNIVSNTVASIVNYSYYPVKASAKFFVTDTGGSTFLENPSGIDSDTSQKIYLTVVPSSTITTTTDDGAGNITTTGYTASSEELAITSKAAASANGMVFALAGATYNFTSTTDATTGKVTYGAQRDTTGTCGVASFKIGGKLNKNADWSQYSLERSPKTLKLGAVFSFNTIPNDLYSYLTAATDGFVQNGTYNMISNNAAAVVSAGVKYDAAKGGKATLSLGTGATESTIKSIQFLKNTTKTVTSSGASTTASAKVGVSKYELNTTKTVVTIPSIPAIATEVAKVDKTDVANFDSARGEYLQIAYSDATADYVVAYDLEITFANGTVSTIPVTFIETIAPEVAYTGANLAKKGTATANSAINTSSFTVSLGNGGASKITSVVLNESKTTVAVSAIDNTKVTITNPAGGGTPTIALAASAFKYMNTAAGKIVYTVTFDSGDTADIEIPVAG